MTRFEQIVSLLLLLRPFDLPHENKRRLGSSNDGGYVLLDRLDQSQTVFSYGLSWNISFEAELANMGHKLFMFDHTIDGLSEQHENFVWLKEGLGATPNAQDELFTLLEHIKRLLPDGQDLVLKLDVEGAEWDALDRLPVGVLERFDQIIVEFHEFTHAADQAWRARATRVLQKLTKSFTIHHVHANNFVPLSVIDGLVVADVIEVSFVRSATVHRLASSTMFPTALDRPNNPASLDYPLWFFPFHPLHSQPAEEVARERVQQASHRISLQVEGAR